MKINIIWKTFIKNTPLSNYLCGRIFSIFQVTSFLMFCSFIFLFVFQVLHESWYCQYSLKATGGSGSGLAETVKSPRGIFNKNDLTLILTSCVLCVCVAPFYVIYLHQTNKDKHKDSIKEKKTLFTYLAKALAAFLAWTSLLMRIVSRLTGLGTKPTTPSSFTGRPIHQSLLNFCSIKKV